MSPVVVVLAEHSIVQPDVIYVSRERVDIVGPRVEGAPDLVFEILSPGTARHDLGDRSAGIPGLDLDLETFWRSVYP